MWIDINHTKPKDNEIVLLYSKSNNITVAGNIYRSYSGTYYVNSSAIKIGTPLNIFTHWMEIPERPQGGNINRELSKEELQELDFDTLQSLQHEVHVTGSAEYKDLVTRAVLEKWIKNALGIKNNKEKEEII